MPKSSSEEVSNCERFLSTAWVPKKFSFA